MVLRIIKNILKFFIHFYIYKDGSSIILGQHPGGKYFKGRFNLSENSSVTLGSNVQFNGFLTIGSNSKIIIEDGCNIQYAVITVLNNSLVKLGRETLLEGQPGNPVIIDIDNGRMELEGFNKLRSNINIQFGGVLIMGKYTSIGGGSDIVCHESVTIGAYGLFSYDICIYDTDSHSVDWQKRRERIEAGHPVGTSETEKPNTLPIVIGDDVWLGRRSVISKGTIIGSRSIVGIGTVVGSGIYPDDSTIVSEKPRVIERNAEKKSQN